MPTPLWTPSLDWIAVTHLTRFSQAMQARHGLADTNYATLHHWSVEHPEQFWAAVWEDAGVVASEPYTEVLDTWKFPGTQWFSGAKLNFAENLLAKGEDKQDAIRFVGEDGTRRVLTYAELRQGVAQCASGLRNAGVGAEDRVAAVVANCPEAVISMLAATSLGAIWSSCSPDFGTSGIHDRLGQISPKALITVNTYHYNDKEHDCLGKVREVASRIPSIQALVAVPFTDTPMNLQENEVAWSDFLDASATTPEFSQFPFNQPSFILSGWGSMKNTLYRYLSRVKQGRGFGLHAPPRILMVRKRRGPRRLSQFSPSTPCVQSGSLAVNLHEQATSHSL